MSKWKLSKLTWEENASPEITSVLLNYLLQTLSWGDICRNILSCSQGMACLYMTTLQESGFCLVQNGAMCRREPWSLPWEFWLLPRCSTREYKDNEQKTLLLKYFSIQKLWHENEPMNSLLTGSTSGMFTLSLSQSCAYHNRLVSTVCLR